MTEHNTTNNAPDYLREGMRVWARGLGMARLVRPDGDAWIIRVEDEYRHPGDPAERRWERKRLSGGGHD